MDANTFYQGGRFDYDTEYKIENVQLKVPYAAVSVSLSLMRDINHDAILNPSTQAFYTLSTSASKLYLPCVTIVIMWVDKVSLYNRQRLRLAHMTNIVARHCYKMYT